MEMTSIRQTSVDVNVGERCMRARPRLAEPVSALQRSYTRANEAQFLGGSYKSPVYAGFLKKFQLRANRRQFESLNQNAAPCCEQGPCNAEKIRTKLLPCRFRPAVVCLGERACLLTETLEPFVCEKANNDTELLRPVPPARLKTSSSVTSHYSW